jgi:hypothetical protein
VEGVLSQTNTYNFLLLDECYDFKYNPVKGNGAVHSHFGLRATPYLDLRDSTHSGHILRINEKS